MDKHGKKDMNSQGLTGNLIEKISNYYFSFSRKIVLGVEQYVGLTNETREQLVCEKNVLKIYLKFLFDDLA
jgi:hypothetical protein